MLFSSFCARQSVELTELTQFNLADNTFGVSSFTPGNSIAVSENRPVPSVRDPWSVSQRSPAQSVQLYSDTSREKQEHAYLNRSVGRWRRTRQLGGCN